MPKVAQLADHGVAADHLVAGMWKLVELQELKKGWATVTMEADEVFDQDCDVLKTETERTVSRLSLSLSLSLSHTHTHTPTRMHTNTHTHIYIG